MHSILRSFATSVLAFGIVLCLAGCGNGGGRTTSNGQSNGNAGNSGNSGNSGNAGNTGNTAQPFTITKATTVNLPGAPTTAISDPGTGHAYVTTHSKDAQGNGTGAVVAINVASATIAATIPAPVGVPFIIAVNTRTHRLYVAFSAVTDAIGVIDTTTNTLIKTIPLKQNEESLNLAVDRATNRIYSASNTIGATPSVTIIDGATNMVVADAPIPQPGLLITVSQSTHRVFVMAQNFSTPDATPVKIYELAGDTGQLLSTNQFAG